MGNDNDNNDTELGHAGDIDGPSDRDCLRQTITHHGDGDNNRGGDDSDAATAVAGGGGSNSAGATASSFARVAAYVSLAPAERANGQVRALRRAALAKGLATRHWPDHACVLAGTGGAVYPGVMEDPRVLDLVG